MSTIELLRAELIASKEELALKGEATRSRIRDILELRKEVERLEAQLSISDKARAETWQQLAEANAALLRNGSSCELCGDPVPKGAAYCSECWLPP